jgi:hypothetical protein
MHTFIKWACLCLLLFFRNRSCAQEFDEIGVKTEVSEPEEFGEAPLDDVVKKEIMMERKVYWRTNPSAKAISSGKNACGASSTFVKK